MNKNMSFEFAVISCKNEMFDFLKSLVKSDSAKVYAYIYKLVEILNSGLIPKESLSKHLTNGIFN